MRKFLSIFMVAVMLVTLTAVYVSAESEYEASLTSEGVTTNYKTYQEALKLACPGDTITLLKDITLNGNESFTITSGMTLTLDGNGYTMYSPYTAIYMPKGYEGAKSSLTVKNLTIDATQAKGKYGFQISGLNDLTLINVKVSASNDGIKVGGTDNVITAKDSEIIGARYGIFASNGCTYNLENTKVSGTEGSCIEVMKGSGAELNLKNCEFYSSKNFCLWVRYGAKVTIDGGTFTTVGNANKQAAIMIDGSGCDVTINGGTFNCDTTSAIQVYSDDSTSKLTINGGTFNYTGADAGSAIRIGGTYGNVECGGILVVNDGVFNSNGKNAVIDGVSSFSDITINKAEFNNTGKESILAYNKAGKSNIDSISFPTGKKTVSYPAPVAETTEAVVPATPVTEKPAETTAPAETDTQTEVVTPATGDSFTVCIAVAVIAIAAVAAVAVVKRKED